VRVLIVDDTEGRGPAIAFPPGENYVDLRVNPHKVEQIAPARKYLPIRNFLTAINGDESVFASARITTRCDSPTLASSDEAYEFASEAHLVFACYPLHSLLNFERDRYMDLTSCLKELLERDPGDAVRVVLRISPCDFPTETHHGFCLGIRVVAQGESTEKAEMRWGLGLARVQQALLFRSRALRQEMGQ
jgi:hypothetical protein